MHPPPPVPPRSYFQHPSRQLPPPHHFPPPHQPQLGAASTTTGVPLPSQESLFSAQRLPAPSFEPFRVRSKRSISPVPRERRRGDWDADDAERMRRWSPHDASLSTSRVREEGSYRTRDREYDRDERRRRRVPDEVYEGRMSERRRSEGGSSRRNRSPSRERDRDRDRDRRRSVSRGLSLRMPWEAERDDGSRSASSSAVRRSRRASLWSGEVDDGVRDVGRLLARSQREESRRPPALSFTAPTPRRRDSATRHYDDDLVSPQLPSTSSTSQADEFFDRLDRSRRLGRRSSLSDSSPPTERHRSVAQQEGGGHDTRRIDNHTEEALRAQVARTMKERRATQASPVHAGPIPSAPFARPQQQQQNNYAPPLPMQAHNFPSFQPQPQFPQPFNGVPFNALPPMMQQAIMIRQRQQQHMMMAMGIAQQYQHFQQQQQQQQTMASSQPSQAPLPPAPSMPNGHVQKPFLTTPHSTSFTFASGLEGSGQIDLDDDDENDEERRPVATPVVASPAPISSLTPVVIDSISSIAPPDPINPTRSILPLPPPRQLPPTPPTPPRGVGNAPAVAHPLPPKPLLDLSLPPRPPTAPRALLRLAGDGPRPPIAPKAMLFRRPPHTAHTLPPKPRQKDSLEGMVVTEQSVGSTSQEEGGMKIKGRGGRRAPGELEKVLGIKNIEDELMVKDDDGETGSKPMTVIGLTGLEDSEEEEEASGSESDEMEVLEFVGRPQFIPKLFRSQLTQQGFKSQKAFLSSSSAKSSSPSVQSSKDAPTAPRENGFAPSPTHLAPPPRVTTNKRAASLTSLDTEHNLKQKKRKLSDLSRNSEPPQDARQSTNGGNGDTSVRRFALGELGLQGRAGSV